MNINILYEDNDIIVCHKKAKIAVESANIGAIDMVSQLKNYLNESIGSTYLGVVHRLDQPVEGIIVFAKNKSAAAKLSSQIEKHKFKKVYKCIVCGKTDLKQGNLVDYLLKDARVNTSKVVKENIKGAKRSELNYTVLEEGDNLSLIEIDLITGRHHQIRVQMKNAGLPLWGDTKYNEQFSKTKGVETALCAYKLEFVHPSTNKIMKFEIEPSNKIFTDFKN